MDADSHKSANHVTIVTDAGGFVKIESPADENFFYNLRRSLPA